MQLRFSAVLSAHPSGPSDLHPVTHVPRCYLDGIPSPHLRRRKKQSRAPAHLYISSLPFLPLSLPLFSPTEPPCRFFPRPSMACRRRSTLQAPIGSLPPPASSSTPPWTCHPSPVLFSSDVRQPPALAVDARGGCLQGVGRQSEPRAT